MIGLSLCLFAAGALLASPAASAANPKPIGGGSLAKHGTSIRALPVLMPLVVPKRTQQRGKARKGSIGSFTATPSTLPPSGGSVRLLAVVESATTCRFSSASTLRSLPSTKDCASGSASVTVSVPKNTTSAARSYVLYLTARATGGTRSTMRTVVVERAQAQSKVAPVITLAPTSQSEFSGTSVTLTAAASGQPRPRVQWQVSTNGGHSWTDVAGATSTRWSFLPEAVANGYVDREYRAVFTNAAGSAATTAGTLTVSAGAAPGVTKGSTGARAVPVITLQPTSQGALSGAGLAVLASAAFGTPIPSVQWQVSTDGGATWTAVAGATSAIYEFVVSGQNGYQYRAVFTNTAGSATTSPATLTVTPGPGSIWSGYVARGETFSAVTGSWTVPTVTCAPGSVADAAQWVGIDGAESPTVEQDGTHTDCAGGTPQYFAWYEIYGDPSLNDGLPIVLSFSAYPVAPGDAITASVSLSGSTWLMALTDTTKGWTSTTPVASPAPPPAQSSAEWIVEDPGGGVPAGLALADFGTVSFTGATATGNGNTGPISSFASTALQMTNGSVPLATIGPLDSTGQDFTDTYAG